VISVDGKGGRGKLHYSAVTGPGAALLGSRSIQGSHVRLRWEEATSLDPATLNGGIHCSRQ
jgi:hypothetical protein